MVKQPKDYFEAMYGINAPWSIQDVAIDEKNKIIQLELNYSTEKSRFSFLSKNSESETNNLIEDGTARRWVHGTLGQYNCYISSRLFDKQHGGAGISRGALLQPNFLGDASRSYTHQMRQQVALAYTRGLSSEAIANMFHVDVSLIEEILTDVEKTPEAYRTACCLPTEADPVWGKIITDKFHLKTQLFSLKLLLSKLKLLVLEKDGEAKLPDAVNELRKFFIAHSNALETEFNQICAMAPRKKAAEESRTAAKLVLPALKNSIWLKLITGKVDLGSKNMPLNLFLVRLRHAFQHTTDNTQRLNSLNSLREFFRKNARQLKAELVLINKLMNAPEENQFTLPNESHDIWKRILKDDNFIPSTHMPYKLLLSNLRSQLLMNPDPVVELNAARKIRDFINHNQRVMQQEMRLLLRNSYAN